MAKNDMMEDALAPRRSAWAAMRNGEGFEPFPIPGDPGFYGPVREELGFREFWRSLKRHKLIALAIIAIITAVGVMVNLRARSTYLASTVLVVGNDSPTVLRTNEFLLQNEESMGSSATAIKTKMVMMKSHELLEDVILDLQLDQDQRFLQGLHQGPLSRLLHFDPSESAPPSTQSSVAELSKGADKGTQRSAQERVRLDPLVRVTEDNLSVEQIKETRALKISFVHTDPEIAASVADKVAQNFIQRNFQSNTESFTNTASWLNQSTMELKRRVQQAEQSLADYTRNNNIFTTEGSSTLTTEKLSKLHDQTTRAESDRVIKEALYEEVKSGRVAEIPEVFAEMTAKSTPRLLDLEKQLGALTTNEAQLNVNFGPSNPQLQEVRQQIAAVKDQITAGRKTLNDKLQAEYEHAVREEQGLKAALAQAKAEAVNENQAAIQFNILKQEVETAKALYTEFLQKSNQSKVRVAEQYSNIHIVDHAKVPTIPNGPRRGLNLLLWFTISVLVGIGMALLLEFLDQTIKNGDDVAQYLMLPTLAVIPSLKTGGNQLSFKAQRETEAPDSEPGQKILTQGKGVISLTGEVIANQQDRLVAMEAYHALRTSVIFSAAEWTPKTILVTSSKPGDGKTTTVVNLAFSLCELDARVLVIDANLRNPTANQMLGLERNLGLSTYLSKGVPAEQLIQHFTKPRLSFLPAGQIPPNPATLISSPKMQSMLEMLRHEYDYILIDSPSFGSVSDTAILSTMVDGVVFVVQGGKSRRDVVARARKDLLSLGARIIGVVINNVHQKSDAYQTYYNSRYYTKQTEQ